MHRQRRATSSGVRVQVINGDWNWILPGKFLAFSGPTCRRREQSVYGTLGAEDYVPIFQSEGVTAVVRLNKPARPRPAPCFGPCFARVR